MKRFRLMYALVLAMVVASCGLLFACTPDTKLPVREPNVDVYYYDAVDGEYTVTFTSDLLVTLVTADGNEMGTSKKTDNEYTLTFSNATYTATLNGDVLAVDFGEGKGVLNFLARVPYTVTFNSNGGSAVASKRVINGRTISKPTDPVNGNKIFIGWYTDAEYTKPFAFESDRVRSDTTLYARWVDPVFGQTEFNVEFDLNYEDAPEVAAKTTVGGKLYDVVTPTRAGYSFEGWWVKAYNADRTNSEFSYRLTADTTFSASTKLYAMWQPTELGSKLATPIVDVTPNGISWGSNVNAGAYKVLVTDSEGNEIRKDDSYGPTNMDIAFSDLPEGKYVISVTALAASGNASNNSEAAIRYYDNKLLAPVSLFTVVEPATLIYNAVDGAEKYYVSVKCGDENHKHAHVDNGSSTSYNFVNCMMRTTGIEFTVTAVAGGRYSSVSETYYYTRPLGDVTGLRYDSAEETVAWNAVPNAAGYTVTLSCADESHSHNDTVDVGNRTSLSLKTYEACGGQITVKVTPYTTGYNSPAPAEMNVEKKSLAAPQNLRIIGNVLSWTGDPDATGYDVYIAGQTVSTDTDSIDLSTVEGITWETGDDYQLRVLAKNATNNSLWSDTVDARYYALYSSLSYNAGAVSWRRVIGAVRYNVRVNDGTAVVVNDGSNSLDVKLTKAGANVIAVNFVDTANKTSSWAQITVNAEEMSFDLRGGEGNLTAQYYAMGDKVTLPNADALTRTGYTFAGWYTTPYGADGLGAKYTDEDYGNVGGLVLYASWKPVTYEITFENGILPVGQETGEATYRQPYSWPIPTSADTSKVFAGWFSDPDGLEIRYTDENGNSVANWGVSRNMTVYACWNSIFAFEKLPNGTYRIGKNTQYWNQYAPADITIPATYRAPGDKREIKVTDIGSASFTSSSMLVTVRIPNSIKYVDTNAFSSSNNITQFIVYDVEGTNFPEYSSRDGVLFHDVIDDFGNITERTLWIYPRGKAGDYVVPDGVTVLPYRAFYSVKATKITVSNTVERIEGSAFYTCSYLTRVEFAAGGEVTEDGTVKPLVIENQAFNNCSKLESIKIPSRLSKFNPEMLATCNAFSTIEVEQGSTKYGAVAGFLTDAQKKTILYCPVKAVVGALEIPAGITTIGDHAFASNTQITELVFPYYLTELKDYAFYKCTNITKVSFKKDDLAEPFDIKIGAHAFDGCTKLVTFDSENGSVVEIGEYAFSGCTQLTAFDIPDKLEVLGAYAFYKCTNLTTVNIPTGLEEIGEYAFSGCTKLVNVCFGTLDEGETASLELCDYAFNGCTGLLSISLPSYVDEIGDAVFGGCTKLAEIEVDENNASFETWMGVLFTKGFEEMLFYPLGRTGEFTMPEEVQTLSAQLFKGNTSLSAIVIGKNVRSIGDEAFMNCTGLVTVTFENEGAIELGEKLFESCTALTTVKLNDHITKIPDRMFYNDKAITEIVMPKYVTEIGHYAFYYLEKIESITIPATVNYIGYSAFKYCNRLSEVTMENAPAEAGPGDEGATEEGEGETSTLADEGDDDDNGGATTPTVTYATTLTFGRYIDVFTSSTNDQSADTFVGCGFTTITIPARMTEIPHTMFMSCTSLEEITIPNKISSIGSKAFSGCTSLKRVIFEEGNLANTLTVYDQYNNYAAAAASGAFTGCSQLEYINLPARIENIPQYMFYNCRALKNITIPASVKNKTDDQGKITTYAIQKSAFENCSSLVTVTFDSENENAVTLGSRAFYGCSKLVTVNFPKGLTYIPKFDDDGNDISDYYDVFDTDAFTNCSAFTTIVVAEGGKYYTDDGILYYHEVKTDEEGEVTEEIREAVRCPQTRTKAVVIPYNVTSINARAFTKAFNITSFAFAPTPEGVEEVDLKINDGTNAADAKARTTGAFNWFIGITTLELPSRLTYIGDFAFYECSMLHTLTIGENSRLIHVGDGAFAKCNGLRIIVVPKTVEKIGVSAFEGCTRINSFTFEDGSALTEIGDRAFASTSFTEIVIPDSVTTLGKALFDGSRLTTVTLPASLEELDVDTFNGCSNLTTVNSTGDNPKYYIEDSVIYNAEKTTLLVYPTSKTAETYEILEGVTTIYDGAFAGNTRIKSIIIPNTVSSIGEGAFYGCTNLTTVYFTPDDEGAATKLEIGGTADENGVFEGCTKLKTVNLPSRTTRLGLNAFKDCTALSELTIHKDAQLQAINAGVFSNAGGGTLTLPDAVTTINSNAFTGSLFTKVVMNNVTTINANAFNGSGITSLVLPATVATIGESAFANCAELVSVEIKLNTTKNLAITTSNSTMSTSTSEANKETYGMAGTFANCPKLKTAVIATNGEIPYYVFYKCNALEELTIKGGGSIKGYLCYIGTTMTFEAPNNMTVGNITSTSVMVGIPSLKKVTIDNTITQIGNYAFDGCINLGSHNPETCVDEHCSGNSAHGFTIYDTGSDSALTTIGTYAFQSTAIKSFVVPSSVTTLGGYAFKFDTALASVTIPTKSFAEIPTNEFYGCTSLSTVKFVDEGKYDERKLVTIANYAFYNCKSLKSFDLTGFTACKDFAFEYSGLTSIVIPDTITSSTSDTATYYIFANCKDLTSVTIPTNASAFIGKCTFQNCTSLKTVTFTGDGSKLTTIGTQAFEGCIALTDFVFPNGLTTVNTKAFANSGVKNIELSQTVTTIDPQAFAGCRLLSVRVSGESGTFTVSSDMKSLLSNDGKTLRLYIGSDDEYTIPDGIEEIGSYAFSGSNIKTVVFSDKIVSIGANAFYGCERLESVTFNDALENVGGYAFSGCTALESIELPEIETLGECMFAGCTALDNVIIPAAVKTIKKGAFMDCTAISSITIPATVATIESAAFAGCTALEELKFTTSSEKLVINAGSGTTAGTNTRGAFGGCTALTAVDLSGRPVYATATATTPTVPGYLFNGCSLLATLKFHASTTEIGTYSIQNCISLENLTLPSSLTKINISAFRGCVLLDRVTFPSGLTVIDSYAFCESGLSAVTLPEGMLTIGTYAFMDCQYLRQINIPGTVKTINSAAFAGCESLETVTFEADDGLTGLGFAAGSTALSFVPTGSLTNCGVFGGCTSLKEIDLSTRCKIYNSATSTGANVTNYIPNYMFADCTSLASVKLPSGIVSVGTGSFFNSGLKSFTLDANTTAINAAAFANCTELETFTVTASDLRLNIVAGSSTTALGSLGAFYNCTSLLAIELGNRPHVYNGTSSSATRTLPAYTFYNCTSLERVTMPDDLTIIGEYAFYNCSSLAEIELPSALEYLNNEAFRGSGLVELYIPDTVKMIFESVFRDCTKLESLHLSTGLSTVHKWSFMDCTSLKSLYIPAGISHLGNACFAGCTSLETIEFEESATPIGFVYGTGTEGEARGMFADCTSLKSVDLSMINVRRTWYSVDENGVELYAVYKGQVRRGAAGTFKDSSGATKNNYNYYPATTYTINSTMPEYMFNGCTGLESVVLGNVMWFGGGYSGDRSCDDQTFGGCTNLKDITWPTDVDFRLGDTSFENCGFETLTIPSNFVGMGIDAFANNKNLTKLTVENNLVWTLIEGFSGCENLEVVELGDGYTGIGHHAFKDCVKLKTINFPESLEYIDEYAFAGCTSLTSIVIPETVTEIGEYAFEGWTATQTIYIEAREEAPEDWSEYWDYNSKQVDVTPEPEEGEEEPDPVFETRPDGHISANIVWGYTRPEAPTPPAPEEGD